MSDSHNDARTVRQAVAAFNARNVGLVLHAGDISSPGLAAAFAGLRARLIAICGNNDREWAELREAFAPYGTVYSGYYDTLIAGRRLALMHEVRRLHELPRHVRFDVIVYGHSHAYEMRPGPPLMLNPGQCGHYPEGGATVAVLDLADLSVCRIDLDPDAVGAPERSPCEQERAG